MSDDIPLNTSLDYISSRLTNVTVTEDYILKLCANSKIQSNNTDTSFFGIFMLILAIYPNFSWFSIPNMAKSKSWPTSLWKFFLMLICIYVLHSAFQTVPADCEKNTQFVKNIAFPFLVLTIFSIFALVYTFTVKGGKNKGFLVFWILIIVITFIYLIINCVDLFTDFISFNLKYLPSLFYFITVGIVLLIQYVNYHKCSNPLWKGEIVGYSFPLLIGFVLLIGRLFKLINMVLMTVNNKNTSLETNTDTSFSFTTTINKHMTNIIEKLEIQEFTSQDLYTKLTEYKVKEDSAGYSYLLKYLGSGIISLGLYYITGKLIKDNLNDPRLGQQSFPIVGFCNSLFTSKNIACGGSNPIAKGVSSNTDAIKDIFDNPFSKVIIGTTATKILFTNYSSNNLTDSGAFGTSAFFTGIKAMLIPYFGGKIHRWYQAIIKEDNGILKGFLKMLYAGLDYDRSTELMQQNTKNKILCKDFVYTEESIFKMIIYFIMGLIISMLFGMNYFTADSTIGLILNGIKLVIVGIVIIIVRNNSKK
jgi:hypothetical protein